MRVTLLLPLTGKQFSEKVAGNCVAIMKAMGNYSDAERQAIEKFLNVFQSETFSPGASILFTQSVVGSLTVCITCTLHHRVIRILWSVDYMYASKNRLYYSSISKVSLV